MTDMKDSKLASALCIIVLALLILSFSISVPILFRPFYYGNTAQMQRYALPDSHFVESNRITPYFCPQERTNSSRQTGSVSQNQIC